MSPSRPAPLQLLVALTALLPACSPAPPPSGPSVALEAQHRAWHAKRVERLQAEDGWLTLIGLHWLEPGENTLGCTSSVAVPLPAGLCAPQAGVLVVDGQGVELRATADSGLSVGGKPAGTRRLATDRDVEPTGVYAGRVRVPTIDRVGRLGVRVTYP